MRLPLLTFLAVAALASGSDAQERVEPVPHFPYPVYETTGALALQTWQAMRDDGGTPIMVGDLEALLALSGPFHPEWRFGSPGSPEEILLRADGIAYPDGLIARRDEQRKDMITWARENGYDDLADQLAALPPGEIDSDTMGEWRGPQAHHGEPLSLRDILTGRYLDTFYIVVVPTNTPTEVPAYLRLGGWNANPPPEYHVAAFRDWQRRYGAVPALVTREIIEFWVPRPPDTPDAAMKLAREQYLYCEDIVLQGTGTVAVLGGLLMNADWWYFWWD